MPLHNHNVLQQAGAFIFVAAIVMVGFTFQMRRTQSIVDNWATNNSFQLEDCRMSWFLYGPYFLRVSKGQSVCRFTVRDRDGQTYTGWARCGSFWGGLWSDAIDVTWNSPSPEAYRPRSDAWS